MFWYFFFGGIYALAGASWLSRENIRGTEKPISKKHVIAIFLCYLFLTGISAFAFGYLIYGLIHAPRIV